MAQSIQYKYDPKPNKACIRPFIGTLVGSVIGLLAIIAWVITFEPHGGPELSHYLFPGSAILLEWMYPTYIGR